jgi:hypothetical protein
MQGATAVDSDIGSPAQTAPAAAPATPSADSATSPGFKQEVEGCTFVVDLVPFKGPKGEPLFVSTTEIPWELFDVLV